MSDFWLESETSPCNDSMTAYSIDKARTKCEVRELDGHGWLVLKPKEGEPAQDTWLQFAVLDFHCSEGDDTNAYGKLVFHGEGPTGVLRECRHTYWGEDGYVFYPSGTVIKAAFKALAEFYDEME